MVRLKRRIIVVIILVISILIILFGVFVGYSYYLYDKMNKIEIDSSRVLANNKEQVNEEGSVINIALLGVDNIGLSDCIMILTINKESQSIKLSSIMRDSLVYIPNYGEGKINWSMTIGGASLTLKTINENYNLSIVDYVKVNLEGLPKLIDKLGGIDIDVNEEEKKYIQCYIDSINSINKSQDSHIKESGYQHLTGTQAIAYCRIRYTEGDDFMRTKRQRKVFKTIAQKVNTLNILEINNFISDILPYVETNLSYSDILDIGKILLSISDKNIKENRFPNDGDWWNEYTDKGYMLNFDKETTAKKINKFIYD